MEPSSRDDPGRTAPEPGREGREEPRSPKELGRRWPRLLGGRGKALLAAGGGMCRTRLLCR
jgi:hypothetical protein